MDPKEFYQKMKEIFPKKRYDEESAHYQADKLMCALLRELGYGKGVKVFEDAGKWYS